MFGQVAHELRSARRSFALLQQGEDKLVEQLTVVCLRDCSHWANQDRCGGGEGAAVCCHCLADAKPLHVPYSSA